MLAASLVSVELVAGKFAALMVVVLGLCVVIGLEPLILAWIAEPGSAFDYGALTTAFAGAVLTRERLLGGRFGGVCADSSPALAAGGSFLFYCSLGCCAWRGEGAVLGRAVAVAESAVSAYSLRSGGSLRRISPTLWS